MACGLIIAAQSSGSGKTLITLGLLRYMARSGIAVASAKIGPDYIDPTFHTTASGRLCVNLDTWAMRPATVSGLISYLVGGGVDLILIEGAMGLFDGAIGANDTENGSTASLAATTGWPVVLVVDIRGQTTSVAAMIQGFMHFRTDLNLAGVILNHTSSPRHTKAVSTALAYHIPEMMLLGAIPSNKRLEIPTRHLGLVQAQELSNLEDFLEEAANIVGTHVNLEAIKNLAQPLHISSTDWVTSLPPLGQRIAVASDDAFTFAYPAVLYGWREKGAEIVPFSPLNNEPPPINCDAIYLPGGYPELHAGTLASNVRFITGLRATAANSNVVFGECGGYMVLGHTLIDTNGHQHIMAGMLPLVTSFTQRRLHLGYRVAALVSDGPLGDAGLVFRGHEFHYASLIQEGPGEPLFILADAIGQSLGRVGLKHCNVMGSFVHLIDTANTKKSTYIH